MGCMTAHDRQSAAKLWCRCGDSKGDGKGWDNGYGKDGKDSKGYGKGWDKGYGKEGKDGKDSKGYNHGPTQDMVSLLLVPSGLVIWCRCVWFQVSS